MTNILVSLLIASILLNSILQQYIRIKQNFTYYSNNIAQHNDLQVASELLRKSVRQAGFTPCGNIKSFKIIDHRTPQKTILPLELSDNGISIKRMNEDFLALLKNSGTNSLLVHNFKIEKGRDVIISDCEHAEIVQLATVSNYYGATLLTLKNHLVHKYKKNSYVGFWVEEEFYARSDGLFYKQAGQGTGTGQGEAGEGRNTGMVRTVEILRNPIW